MVTARSSAWLVWRYSRSPLTISCLAPPASQPGCGSHPVVVGVVVIGLGTSAPEFLVSGVAAAKGDTGIAIGNIVGSNILNLTLILGVAAMIASVGVSSTVIRREVRLSVAAVVVFAAIAWFGINVWSAIALTVATVLALLLLMRWARLGRNDATR